MYDFIDVNETQSGDSLPSEALKINGEYIENMIDGYRTLYTKGRELLAPELNTFSVASADGEKLKSKRYPVREITVGYQLIAKDNGAFRTAYNKLNGILSVSESELIFADESDKYFKGTLSEMEDVDTGMNAVKGEFTFTCTDPFKRSVEKKEVKVSENYGQETVIDYEGTFPSYPEIEVTMNGDNGFIGVFNDRGNVLQVGDPADEDGATTEKSVTVFRSVFASSTTGWTANSATLLTDRTTQTGSFKASSGGLQVSSYGSGEGWHGAGYTRKTTTSAVNCGVDVALRLLDDSVGHTMNLQILLEDSDGNNVAGFVLTKGDARNEIYVKAYADGKHKSTFETFAIPISTGTLEHFAIRKFGSQFTFIHGTSVFTINASAMKDTAVTTVSLYAGVYGDTSQLDTLDIVAVKFVQHNAKVWSDVPNAFSLGDIVTIDCSASDVLVNDAVDNSLGAIGNEWEQFYLSPGTNQYKCIWSNWVTANEQPSIVVKYREVYL